MIVYWFYLDSLLVLKGLLNEEKYKDIILKILILFSYNNNNIFQFTFKDINQWKIFNNNILKLSLNDYRDDKINIFKQNLKEFDVLYFGICLSYYKNIQSLKIHSI